MKLSGSILSNKYTAKEAISVYDKTDIDFVHIDVMDGKFVNNKTYTIGDIIKFSKLTNKPMDVHLMVNNPDKYIDDLSMLNVNNITFHLEATKKPMDIINHIKNNGIKVGMAISPDTNVKNMIEYIPYLDYALVMTVVPGASGQKFMESMLYKIDILKKIIIDNNYKTLLYVDGGVNEENISLLEERGVDMIVSSNYFLSNDTKEIIKQLKKN